MDFDEINHIKDRLMTIWDQARFIYNSFVIEYPPPADKYIAELKEMVNELEKYYNGIKQ